LRSCMKGGWFLILDVRTQISDGTRMLVPEILSYWALELI